MLTSAKSHSARLLPLDSFKIRKLNLRWCSSATDHSNLVAAALCFLKIQSKRGCIHPLAKCIDWVRHSAKTRERFLGRQSFLHRAPSDSFAFVLEWPNLRRMPL